MASPQKENGYTPIANELLEQLLLFNYPSVSPLKVVLCIARKTYGYSKPDDNISLTQLQKYTNLSRQTVVSCIRWLLNSRIISKTESDLKGTVFKIQKDYEKWVVNAPRLVNAVRLEMVKGPRLPLVKGPRHTKTIYKTKNNTVANATEPADQILINSDFTPMSELEYISEELPVKGKSKYGNRVMAVLVRAFANSAGIEILGTFDASPWSKPLSAVYQYFDKDADLAIAFIQRASEYFEEKNLSYTPHTLHKDLPMIDKWIQEKENKKFSHLDNNPLYE